MIRVGIDTGGTFTDFVLMSPDGMTIRKVLSTPRDPGEAILQGLRECGVADKALDITHGSTVATNSLLERKGAKLAFLTTAGFEDLLEIGRQTRRELYNIMVEKRRPLIPRRLCLGINERTGPDGAILKRADPDEIRSVAARLKKESVESVAVCFLHSYLNPENEETVIGVLEAQGLSVSASHRILREYREYERASTTAINAFVAPVMERYLGKIEAGLGAKRLRIMQSNGGCISAAGARRTPGCTILSGPAGGAVGALETARLSGFANIISFDMGGTSTDVSLCEGALMMTTESLISDLPVKMPVIDIHTVGSGGGSIAGIDEGGALRVGPQSAGADPGPICYGRGGEVTVTDANLALGRLDPERFLGGTMKLYPERTFAVMRTFAKRLGLDLYGLAEGIVKVADATMERAIRVISIERGYDPRDFALLSFGGAGGMHACSLARKLRIPAVLVPKNAGVLSALGMLLSDTVKDYSQSVLKAGDKIPAAEFERLFTPMLKTAAGDLAKEGYGGTKIRLLKSLDVRYSGQSYELTVPFSPLFRREFDGLHLRRYGYSDEKRPVEVVTLRVKAVGLTDKPVLPRIGRGGKDPRSAHIDRRPMRFDGKVRQADVFSRDLLSAGNVFRGPALVLDYEATTVVPPDFVGRVDDYGTLALTPLKRT